MKSETRRTGKSFKTVVNEALKRGPGLGGPAHLAALAIEHQAELQSTDADFARFAGLRWRNPIA